MERLAKKAVSSHCTPKNKFYVDEMARIWSPRTGSGTGEVSPGSP